MTYTVFKVLTCVKSSHLGTGEVDELHILGGGDGVGVHPDPGAGAGHHQVEGVVLPLLGGGTDPRPAVGLGHRAGQRRHGVHDLRGCNGKNVLKTFRKAASDHK